MPSTAAEGRLEVAVAAIIDAEGRVLVSLRADHLHQGGLWEFPGGKIEAGETVRQALARELQEELGIQPESLQPLIRIPHRYPDREVMLDVWCVSSYTGEPHGREGQPIDWMAIDALDRQLFPAANGAIIRALQLPPFYLITPEPDAGHIDTFLQRLEQRIGQGCGLVQLRAPSWSENDYAELAAKVVPVCQQAGARVLLNGDPQLVPQINADGIHLSSQRLGAYRQRPLPDGSLVMASCHNPEQLRQAQEVGADAVVLSPVQATASHPEAQPLGWDTFADWVDQCAMPVYALGGMKPADRETAQSRGGQGIAAIRALWDAS